jgi:hypothetical protein
VASPVRAELEGAKELIRTFEHAPTQLKRAYRKKLPDIAEPTRLDAQRFALDNIRRMFDSPQWARMRTVVGSSSAYIAPQQRGVRSGPKKRPNLATLLESRALDPAAEAHEKQVEHDFDQLNAKLIRQWENDGP